MKITVVTPSIREYSLDLNDQSLSKQTMDSSEWEWIVGSPFPYKAEFTKYNSRHIYTRDKNPDDFNAFHKSLNDLFKAARGELIVMFMDSQYLEPQGLEKFWKHYQDNPMSCVAALGNHYEEVINGVGHNITYEDIRRNQAMNGLTPCSEITYDTCCSSVPTAAIKAVGGMDEDFDHFCCFGDRDMMVRIRNLGYQLFIDQHLEFVGRKHDKPYDPDDRWPEMFEKGEQLYLNKQGAPDRQKLNFV